MSEIVDAIAISEELDWSNVVSPDVANCTIWWIQLWSHRL